MIQIQTLRTDGLREGTSHGRSGVALRDGRVLHHRGCLLVSPQRTVNLGWDVCIRCFVYKHRTPLCEVAHCARIAGIAQNDELPRKTGGFAKDVAEGGH